MSVENALAPEECIVTVPAQFDSVNSTCGGGFSFYGYWKIRSIVKIFCGTSNLPLAKAITASIGTELGKCTVSAFPDGETFVKIEENVRGEDVFLVQSTSRASILRIRAAGSKRSAPSAHHGQTRRQFARGGRRESSSDHGFACSADSR